MLLLVEEANNLYCKPSTDGSLGWVFQAETSERVGGSPGPTYSMCAWGLMAASTLDSHFLSPCPTPQHCHPWAMSSWLLQVSTVPLVFPLAAAFQGGTLKWTSLCSVASGC